MSAVQAGGNAGDPRGPAPQVAVLIRIIPDLEFGIPIADGYLDGSEEGGELSTEVKAPMAGKILEVKVKMGDHVQEDDILFILEAMKMEQPILAAEGGIVQAINVEEGQAVESGRVLAVLG